MTYGCYCRYGNNDMIKAPAAIGVDFDFLKDVKPTPYSEHGYCSVCGGPKTVVGSSSIGDHRSPLIGCSACLNEALKNIRVE